MTHCLRALADDREVGRTRCGMWHKRERTSVEGSLGNSRGFIALRGPGEVVVMLLLLLEVEVVEEVLAVEVVAVGDGEEVVFVDCGGLTRLTAALLLCLAEVPLFFLLGFDVVVLSLLLFFVDGLGDCFPLLLLLLLCFGCCDAARLVDAAFIIATAAAATLLDGALSLGLLLLPAVVVVAAAEVAVVAVAVFVGFCLPSTSAPLFTVEEAKRKREASGKSSDEDDDEDAATAHRIAGLQSLPKRVQELILWSVESFLHPRVVFVARCPSRGGFFFWFFSQMSTNTALESTDISTQFSRV